LPLFSSLVLLLPEKGSTDRTGHLAQIARIAALLALFAQFVLFLNADYHTFVTRMHRADNNTSIKFYDQVLAALKPLPNSKLHVYYDYRMYVPGKAAWVTETNFDLLEYNYIQKKNFDVLLLQQQRIRDYLNPNAVGIDPALFARNQQFYRDADNARITGYHLVYRDKFGLIFVRDELYQKYYPK
jgi:hypothetical protein